MIGRLASLALLALWSVQPPNPPPSASAAQQPIRTATLAIEVDVRVFDKGGRFVRTLGPEDFEVLEDGAPQPVVGVWLVDGARVTQALPSGASAPPDPPPAAPSRQTWVFVFDTRHLAPGNAARARTAVQAFIRERFAEGDMGGVVADGVMIGNRLTSVRSELEKAAASVTFSGNVRSRELDRREWPRFLDDLEPLQIARNDRETLRTVVTRACSDDPSMCGRGMDPEALVREKAARVTSEIRADTLTTLKTTAALASGLSRVPGPKTVVFVSDGFVVDTMEEPLRTVVGQAARSGARFYAIDARGLNRGASAEIIDQRSATDPAGAGARFDLLADGTNSLAVDTGGFVVRNENDVGRALARIADDSRTYYVLGYRPSNTSFDGKYRRIDVGVRPAGLTVRARRGYLALEPSRMLVPTAAPPPAPEGAAPGHAVPPPAPSAVPLPGEPLARPELPLHTAAPRVRGNADELVSTLSGGAVRSSAAGTVAAEGWAAYQRGDLAAAALALGDAASRPDAPAWVHYALGYALLAQGQRQEAEQSWQKVRGLAPEFQAVYFDLADVRVQLGDDAGAVAVLREAEKRWPADPDVYNALGVVQVRRGALDAAVESFEKAVAIAPAEPLGHFNLGRAYQMRYLKSVRYVATLRRWVGNERDRDRAAEQFERYLAIGGPYEQQAREAIASLSWRMPLNP